MRFTVKASFMVALSIGAAGCTSQAQMDSTQPQRVVQFAENYQAVYSRSYRGMRNCNSTSMFSTHGELYSELGYGEITTLAGGLASSQPMMRIKVIKIKNGTRAEFTTLTTAREGSMNWMEYWSRGGLACPIIHYSEAPPASP